MASNGDICVNTLKKDWNPAKWSLKHILGVIRCLLIIPFPESSLNEEAGRLFMDDYKEYSRMAKLITKIHAQSSKKEEEMDEVDENENIICPKVAEKLPKEETKEKFISSVKFQYKHASNRDVSMEEEDKAKGPLQNFSNMMHSSASNSEETVNITEVPSFSGKSSKVSGASLFGTKTEGIVKKPKNKKKKVRRI